MQAQLLPQLACQPAATEQARAAQFQTTQFHLQAVDRIGGNLAVIGKQTQVRDPDSVKRWLTFLRNHCEAIAAMDFFTAPTLTFGVLYCFFVISHDRRKIVHFNVTRNPNALGIIQQLREAWAHQQPHRFLLLDRDAKFGAKVVSAAREIGSKPTRTALGSPWQNGVAESWVGSCRRDLLEHVIILNERHLKRLQKFALRVKGRFNPFRDSVACTIVMRWQRRFKSCFSESQIPFFNPARHSPRSLRAFSRIDESACNPKPKDLRQGERNPFNVAHDDLANYQV